MFNAVAISVLATIGGFIIGVLANNKNAEQKAGTKVEALHGILLSVIGSNKAALDSLSRAMHVQEKTISKLFKDNKMLKHQLDEASEIITDITGEAKEDSDEDSEDDEEEEGAVAVRATAKKQLHIDSVPSPTMAEDKLATIDAWLTDAVAKKQTIDPETLLGIVKHKRK